MSGESGKSAYAERKKFIEQVHRYEAESKASPARYEARCRTMVGIGHFYLGFVIFLLFAVLGLLVYGSLAANVLNGVVIKIGLVILIAIGGIVISLFKRLPDDDDGVIVSRAQAPRLWAEVDRLREALKAPKIHVIRITPDWNASASQIPLLGMFGPCKNTLRYGFPLLAGETPDETRATIAHELGHFAGDHSKFGGVVYRSYETWRVADEQLGGASALLLRPFLNWYLPKLWATTFPLRRQAEYQADEAATRLVGARPNALNLTRLNVMNSVIAKYHDDLGELVTTNPLPPANYVSQFANTVHQGCPPDEFEENLKGALEQETTYDDSHPCLKDRLVAIDPSLDPSMFRDELCRPLGQSAAMEFLGSEAPKVAASLDAKWSDAVRPGWEMRHRQIAPAASQLKTLETADLSVMPLPELASHLAASVTVRGTEGSLFLAKAVLERNPMHGIANLVVASSLSKTDKEKAREHFEIASRDPETRRTAYQALSHLAEQEGKENEAAKYFDLADKEGDVEEEFFKEIYDVPPTAAFRNAVFDGDLEAVTEILAHQEAIQDVHYVEFDSRVRPGSSHQIFMIQVKYPSFVVDEDAFVAKVIEGLQNLPFNCRIIRPKEKAYKKAMDKLPGALVYSRQST